MTSLNNLFEWRTIPNQPIEVGEITLTPYTKQLIIHWPTGVWLWQQPAFVLAQESNFVRYIRIINKTRLIQLSIVAIGILFGLWSLLITARR